jgi:SpoVK/Ycf46/Vps4 family AAA+-type ATPase
VNKYCKAAEYLLTALKYEKNPVTLKTIREKCTEYTSRAETLKKGLDNPNKPGKAAKAGGGDADEKDDDDDDEPEPEPLTEEQLVKAEAEMEEELSKCARARGCEPHGGGVRRAGRAHRRRTRALSLVGRLVGMESVKRDMRKLCKQLSLDIKRRQEGRSTLDSIRHMMFTGNPGVGKTTVSRLVAKLYHQLGVSSQDTVVEVQKGDLVAGCARRVGACSAFGV